MQSQPGILDLSAYNLPKSDSLPLRIQENFSLYSVRYTQLVVVGIAIGGSAKSIQKTYQICSFANSLSQLFRMGLYHEIKCYFRLPT
ncbi:unnamed protein product [Paramecium sonneborni]|uniref:Uncharacterized protein n=1 Tax=Paramecium sonneborni TaxID=65129 RepID=A0A8S1MN10_9CILI|nr:unnamed protein product [Paramecium sonneborni]